MCCSWSEPDLDLKLNLADAQRKVSPTLADDLGQALTISTFGGDFRQFGNPLPNAVYACHDYSK